MASSQDGLEDFRSLDPGATYIAVMGLSGAGKSTFISKCIQHDGPRVGHSLNSCTWTTAMYKHVVDGTTVYLIDTPGFNDHRRSDAQTLEEISLWLSEAFKHGFRLTGVIYLHRITDVRIGGSSRRSLDIFKKICGPQNFHQCLLITTHWDIVLSNPNLQAQALTRQSEILNEQDLWGDVIQGGGWYGALKDEQSASRLLVNLVRQPHAMTLLLQEQLMAPGSRLADTDAGKVVVDDVQEAFKKLQQELKELKEEVLEAQRVQHSDRVQELRDLVQEIEARGQTQTRSLKDLQTVHQRSCQVAMDKIRIERERLLRDMRHQQELNQKNFDRTQNLCNEMSAQLRAYQKQLKRAECKSEVNPTIVYMTSESSGAMPPSSSPPPPYHAHEDNRRRTRREVSHPATNDQVSEVREGHRSQGRSRSGIAEIVGAGAGIASVALTAATLGCVLM